MSHKFRIFVVENEMRIKRVFGILKSIFFIAIKSHDTLDDLRESFVGAIAEGSVFGLLAVAEVIIAWWGRKKEINQHPVRGNSLFLAYLGNF